MNGKKYSKQSDDGKWEEELRKAAYNRPQSESEAMAVHHHITSVVHSLLQSERQKWKKQGYKDALKKMRQNLLKHSGGASGKIFSLRELNQMIDEKETLHL